MNPYSPSLFEEYLSLLGNTLAQQAFLVRYNITTPMALSDFLTQYNSYIEQSRSGLGGGFTSQLFIEGNLNDTIDSGGSSFFGGGSISLPDIDTSPIIPPGSGIVSPLTCQPNEYYDFNTQSCRSSTPIVDTVCTFPQYYDKVSKSCKSCRLGELYSTVTEQCEPIQINLCSEGFEFSTQEGRCVPIITPCPENSSRNLLSGQCECNQGFISAGGECVPRLEPCPPNSTRVRGQGCICNEGYINVNGVCTLPTELIGVPPCPAGFIRDSNGNCVPSTTPSTTGIGGPRIAPVCTDPNASPDINGVCRCNIGYESINGVCTLPTELIGVPPCPAGFIRDSNGNCVPSTTPSTTGIGGPRIAPVSPPVRPIEPLPVDPNISIPTCSDPNASLVNGVCRCNTGYESVNGVCVTVCPTGSTRNNNGECVSTTPPEPPPCPTNSIRNSNGICVCATGYRNLQPVPNAAPVCVVIPCPAGQVKDSEGKCIPEPTTPPPTQPKLTCTLDGYEPFDVLNLGDASPLCCPAGRGIEPEPGVPNYFRCAGQDRLGAIVLSLDPRFDPSVPYSTVIQSIQLTPDIEVPLKQEGSNALMFIDSFRAVRPINTITKPGRYTITFQPLPGYITPEPQVFTYTQEDIDNARFTPNLVQGNQPGVSYHIIVATWRQAPPPTVNPRPTIYTFYHAFGKLGESFIRQLRGNGFFDNVLSGVGQYSIQLNPGEGVNVSCGPVAGYLTPPRIRVEAVDEGTGTTPVYKEYEFKYIEEGPGIIIPEPEPFITVEPPPIPIQPPAPAPPPDRSGRVIIVTEYFPDLPGIPPDKLKEGQIFVNGEFKGRGSVTLSLAPGRYTICFGDLDSHPLIIYTTPKCVELEVLPNGTHRVLGRYVGKYKIESRWLHPLAPIDMMTSHLRFTKGMFSDDIENLLTYHTSSINTSLDNHYTHVYQIRPEAPGAEIQFSLAYGHIEGSGSNDQGGQYNDTPTRAIYGQYRSILIGNAKGRFNLTGQETDHIYVVSYQKDRRDTRADYNALELNIAHLSGSEYINGTGSMLTHTGSNVKLGGEGKVLRLISDFKINENPELGYGGYEYNIISGSIEDGPYNPDAVHRYGKLYPSLGIVVLDAAKLDLSASFGTVTSREVDGKNQLKLFTALSGAAQYNDITGNDPLGMKARATKEEIVNYYFINVRNKMANFTNNPSYYDLASGEIYGDNETRPRTYITTIGLYDENRQLLAVAKTSKPEIKSFTEEVIYNVRLKM
jgi:hypothetical protein